MFFPPCFRADAEITIWGPGLARGVARGPDRPLHLGAALAGRGPRASVLGLLPRHAGERVAARLGDDPRRGGHPPRPDARLPDHRRATRRVCYIPDHEPALGAAARRARAGVDLRLRPRPRRRPADPRLPVHRRRVPRPRRLGPLGASSDALTFADAGRRAQAAALPPRSAALRRLPRRARTRRPDAAGRSSAATRR